MSKHTPSPWRVSEMHGSDYIAVKHDDVNAPFGEFLVASVRSWATKRAEGEANARLIAAAPTMLSLLQRIHADADSKYEGASNNGQAKISAELYQELCEFVARFNP